MKDKILIALDVPSRTEALRLVQSLHDLTGMFKVGLQLYTAEGPALVRSIIDAGGRVFLDLKFHDIPNTARHAALEAAKLGVSMMTIHTSGGRAMMEAVAAELRDQFGDRKPIVVGVTVLTSLDEAAIREIGVSGRMDDHVLNLARLAEASGLDGVVCSPQEIQAIRKVVGRSFKIVTPGVRMPGQSTDDQQRTATPREAIGSGADYIVVGRPVTKAADPRAALQGLLQSL